METTRTAVEIMRDFRHDPEPIWRVIGRFAAYDWMAGAGRRIIGGDLDGNAIGSVRAFQYHGAVASQRLTSHCVRERRLGFESLSPFGGVRHYEMTLRVVASAGRNSTVIWQVMFEAPICRRDDRAEFFREEIGKSLANLDAILELSLSG